jgi:hypothetical protein
LGYSKCLINIHLGGHEQVLQLRVPFIGLDVLVLDLQHGKGTRQGNSPFHLNNLEKLFAKERDLLHSGTIPSRAVLAAGSSKP